MSKRLEKIVQLDSLRAVAALAVITHHFLPEFKFGNFTIGRTGVDLFFVISGYLITAILLSQKDKISNKFLIMKNFIIKRVLRLFPAYYLFITFFLLLSVTLGIYVWDSGDGIFYYTYTQNILFFNEGLKGIQTNHLWTLAVEEQFYLLWPWFVIYISNKKLIVSLLIIIPATIVLKSFSGITDLRFLTFAHFDTLGAGALIALLQIEKKQLLLMKLNQWRVLLIPISLIGLIVGTHYYLTLLSVISIVVLSVSLLIGSFYGFTGIFGKVLGTPFIIYLGQISYGLYLYHKPIPYFINLALLKTHMPVNGLILLVFSFLMTFIVAHLSYIIIEKRLLDLKVRFDL